VVDTYWGLFFGYSAIWLILAVYLGSLGKRIKSIELQLNESKNDKDTKF
jgi:CcmD family protein